MNIQNIIWIYEYIHKMYENISKYFHVVPEMGVLDKEISTPKRIFFLFFRAR